MATTACARNMRCNYLFCSLLHPGTRQVDIKHASTCQCVLRVRACACVCACACVRVCVLSLTCGRACSRMCVRACVCTHFRRHCCHQVCPQFVSSLDLMWEKYNQEFEITLKRNAFQNTKRPGSQILVIRIANVGVGFGVGFTDRQR